MNHYSTRQDFGKLFMEVYQTGKGVELGVQLGWNALSILNHWKGELICVDKWTDVNEYHECIERLNYHNVSYIRNDTVEAAAEVPDGSLDFVYHDADHSFEGLKRDYEAWYPKVRSGGIVSGHDYGDNEFPDVKKFVDLLGIPFHLTTDDFWEGKEYQSWWFIKP